MIINDIQNTGNKEIKNSHERKKYDMLMGNNTEGEAMHKLGKSSNMGWTS